jgi:epoxyqueuosine reductase
VLKDKLCQLSSELGFVLCGVAPAISSPDYPKLLDWIDRGYAGEMSYFRDRLTAYQHPDGILAGAKSILMLAFPYDQGPAADVARGSGRVARYAWSGEDYHDLIHPKLKRLCRLISDQVAGAKARGIVDTAPLLEREFAELAGLGWRGKNTLLLNKNLGSYFFLACVLVDIDLPVDQPHATAHCGSCTACLDACPTDAFPSAGVLDATRCISYLTIEHRSEIDRQFRKEIGDWVFGCDVCQQVCPWNRKPSRRAAAVSGAAPLESLELRRLFTLSDEQFRARFRKTPLWRTRRRGVLRNAAIVLGNQRDSQAVAALTAGLEDGESIVRGAAAWALGQIGESHCVAALARRLAVEEDGQVRAEIESALALITPS